MRLLHTSDWHLGRTIRNISRQPEFERVVQQVVDVALDEHVDVVLLAGDTFDTFAPSPECERLLFDALTQLLRAGVRVVSIAGNHDSAGHMDALAGVLQIAGARSVGSVPRRAADAAITVTSRDGSEAATVVALPWVPERLTIDYDELFAGPAAAMQRYAGRLEAAIAQICSAFRDDTANLLVAHLLVDKAVIGEGGGERKLQIGQAFAVQPASLPATAQYIALGHVHRRQRIGTSPAWYSGSLLQLDFGEAEQAKYVQLVDVQAGLPAQARAVEITGGRGLRNVRLRLEDLPQHAGRYGEDYLRVFVELDAPVLSLYERVREVLPNALDVKAETAGGAFGEQPPRHERRDLMPDQLLARYYREQHGGAEIQPELLALFTELYNAETQRAAP
ncbi:MAG: exonuclease SbcCD subunit D [Dehalococcoidia bacterium]|nr:exonuclease SbcCD subunit D [Dehalococcoidia bacterium]